MGIGNLIGLDGRAAGQDLFDSGLVPAHPPGFEVTDGFGNSYRYAKAGAVALVVGNAVQAPAQVANHQQLTPAAAAIGDTTITATLGATAAAENQYAGGWAIIDTTPGLGQPLIIEGHAAVLSGGVITLKLGQPLRVALTTSSRVTLVPNPHVGLIAMPTTPTASYVGQVVFPMGIGEWGWIQTGGLAPALIQGTPAVGNALSPSGTTAGALAINSGTLDVVASAMVTGVDGKVFGVKLKRM